MKHPDILKQLTLEQKVALLSGKDVWSTYAFPQAGVPSMVMSDGPHGLRRQLGRGDHLGQRPSQPATCFPTAACLAGSWDPALLEEVGRALGTEAAAQGVHMLLGPGMNLKRSPLGGRNFEYFSEDPYLSGKLAAALVRGVQSQGAAACIKHFAANSQELLRMTSDSVVDERTLRELYLTGFEIAVKEGRPLGVMSSYNRVNGTYANENPHLLTEILREEWGFTGMVVTDWGACNRQVDGLRAGSNLEMPGTQGDSDREVLSALDRGELTEDVIDRRVDELLDVVLATTEAARTAPKHFDEGAHHALARRAAAESAVLLKNEDSLLPLAPGTKVAVLGDLALEPRYQGAGSSLVRPTRLDRPLDCLKESGLKIIGHAKAYRRNGQPSEHLEREAAELARRAEAVILFLGIPECFESEGLDRDHLALPDNQVRALEVVAQANPNVVVVLAGGGVLELPWLDRCKALLHGYLGGQAGAGAAADLLTGKVDPSGRLAETFPLVLADAPNARYFPGRERTAEYREGLFVGYRYYQTVGKPVAFPFGFGLSYTTFAYSDLSVRRDGVSFTLTNTGARPGAEVAQVYLTGPRDRVFRPALELKGFQKVTLQPGESRRVAIPLDGYAFRWFNPRTNQWAVEGGHLPHLRGPQRRGPAPVRRSGSSGDRPGGGVRQENPGLLLLRPGGGRAGRGLPGPAGPPHPGGQMGPERPPHPGGQLLPAVLRQGAGGPVCQLGAGPHGPAEGQAGGARPGVPVHPQHALPGAGEAVQRAGGHEICPGGAGHGQRPRVPGIFPGPVRLCLRPPGTPAGGKSAWGCEPHSTWYSRPE